MDWDERVEIDGLISRVQGRMASVEGRPAPPDVARAWADLLAGVDADPGDTWELAVPPGFRVAWSSRGDGVFLVLLREPV